MLVCPSFMCVTSQVKKAKKVSKTDRYEETNLFQKYQNKRNDEVLLLYISVWGVGLFNLT